jgi:hypothetical protein
VILTSLIVAGIGVLGTLAVADALRSGRSPSTSATSTSTTPSVSTEEEEEEEEEEAVTAANDSSEEIEQIGNKWALLFAAGPLSAACEYETQPLCERIACVRVGGIKIRNCTRPTSAFRNSFFGATVLDIEIKGHRAAARFSNGAVIELYGDAGTWLIHKLGGNAGRRFFE